MYFQDPEGAVHMKLGWNEILERIGLTGLGSRCISGKEEMTLTALILVLKRARYRPPGGFRKVWRRQVGETKETEEESRELTGSVTAAPLICN